MIKGIRQFINKKTVFALALLTVVFVPASAQAADNNSTTRVAPIYFATDKKDVNHYLWQKSNAASKKILAQQEAKEQAAKKAEATRNSDNEAPAQRTVKTATHNMAFANGANDYAYGTCTWYVKNMLPWVPANLGDAASWAANAAAQGYLVDQRAAVGSVVVFAAGQAEAGAAGHVAVVIAVNGNDSITISEGNFAGLPSHTRTVYEASSYLYIHP